MEYNHQGATSYENNHQYNSPGVMSTGMNHNGDRTAVWWVVDIIIIIVIIIIIIIITSEPMIYLPLLFSECF